MQQHELDLLPCFRWVAPLPAERYQEIHKDPPYLTNNGLSLGFNACSGPVTGEWGPAVSDITYTKGKLYFEMGMAYVEEQVFGVVSERYNDEDILHYSNETLASLVYFRFYGFHKFAIQSAHVLGVYSDLDNERMKLYLLDDYFHPTLISHQRKPPGPVKFYGWVKDFGSFHFSGRESFPIPSFVKP